MRFEYDPDKSSANRQKHGIDFEEAQALWTDPNLLEIPARGLDEPRFLVSRSRPDEIDLYNSPTL